MHPETRGGWPAFVFIEEPFRTIALVSLCFGLRISGCLALKWADVDWFNSRLYIRRGIVRQRVGETKAEYSNRPLVIDGAMLAGIVHSIH